MTEFGLETEIVDRAARDRAVERFRAAGIALPTFAQLADPSATPAAVEARLKHVAPDAPDPANLFRVHWFNGPNRGAASTSPGISSRRPSSRVSTRRSSSRMAIASP